MPHMVSICLYSQQGPFPFVKQILHPITSSYLSFLLPKMRLRTDRDLKAQRLQCFKELREILSNRIDQLDSLILMTGVDDLLPFHHASRRTRTKQTPSSYRRRLPRREDLPNAFAGVQIQN